MLLRANSTANCQHQRCFWNDIQPNIHLNIKLCLCANGHDKSQQWWAEKYWDLYHNKINLNNSSNNIVTHVNDH